MLVVHAPEINAFQQRLGITQWKKMDLGKNPRSVLRPLRKDNTVIPGLRVNGDTSTVEQMNVKTALSQIRASVDIFLYEKETGKTSFDAMAETGLDNRHFWSTLEGSYTYIRNGGVKARPGRFQMLAEEVIGEGTEAFDSAQQAFRVMLEKELLVVPGHNSTSPAVKMMDILASNMNEVNRLFLMNVFAKTKESAVFNSVLMLLLRSGSRDILASIEDSYLNCAYLLETGHINFILRLAHHMRIGRDNAKVSAETLFNSPKVNPMFDLATFRNSLNAQDGDEAWAKFDSQFNTPAAKLAGRMEYILLGCPGSTFQHKMIPVMFGEKDPELVKGALTILLAKGVITSEKECEFLVRREG